jgi:hypothetical protein
MILVLYLGPKEPAYPAICCEEFRPGQVCDGNVGNILEAQTDYPHTQNWEDIK